VAEQSSSSLTSAEAVPLGSALVSFLAKNAGIRAMLIKGLIVEQLGLRPPRLYADIDVLVDPRRFDDFVAELAAVGWRERIHLWLFDKIDEHSMTLIHDNWPIDIDVHRYYPGFLATPERVFDALWEHRQEFAIADQPVVGTNEVAAASVLGLHALRYLHTERNVFEYEYLVEQLASRPGVPQSLAVLATATGSAETLAPLFQRLKVTPKPSKNVSKADIAAWNRRVAHPSRTGEWMTYFRNLPIRHWPREVRAVLWPPSAMYRQDHPDVPATRRALFVARLRRLRHGLAGVAKALPASFRRP
jgi:hypothetical protein